MAKKKKSTGKKRDAPKRSRREGMSKVIIRVLGTDLDGEKPIQKAILKIKGIGHSMSNAFCTSTSLDPDKKLGALTEEEISGLEKSLKNIHETDLPKWLFNRRKDIETGENMHLTSADVDVYKKFDIQRMVDRQTYKGVRHMLGLPVRGQRTKSSFRGGETVGVIRKSVRAQKAAGEKKRGKKKSK